MKCFLYKNYKTNTSKVVRLKIDFTGKNFNQPTKYNRMYIFLVSSLFNYFRNPTNRKYKQVDHYGYSKLPKDL